MDKDEVVPSEFSDFLDKTKGEREISKYIEEHPQLLYWSLCRPGGHSRFVFREFPLGSRFLADFVVLNSVSGLWQAKFIEFEPVDDRVFTKKGLMGERLNSAVKQVDEWMLYFEENKAQVRSDFVLWAKTKDLLKYSRGSNPVNYSGNLLSDPASYILPSFHIFIGRRKNLSSEDHSRKAMFRRQHNVELITYDRLLDLVRIRYRETSDST